MSKKVEKLHNHPHLEKKLGVDDEHVIIDKHTFYRLLKLEQGGAVSSLVTKAGKTSAIVKALMSDESDLRLSKVRKWLVYDTQFKMWVVYEQVRWKVVKVCETENEDEAVAELLK